jgi:uncharacterized protein (DUF433 family)
VNVGYFHGGFHHETREILSDGAILKRFENDLSTAARTEAHKWAGSWLPCHAMVGTVSDYGNDCRATMTAGGIGVTRRIDARELIVDIRSGMRQSELMEKYSLSRRDLQRLLDRISRERSARARAIAADLKKGLSDIDIMKTYQLSSATLHRILKALLEEGLLNSGDLKNRNASPYELVILDLRKEPRHIPDLPVTICDQGADGNCVKQRHVIENISEHGLAVKGIEVEVHDIRRIVVLGDDFGEVAPFEFEAECRWTTRDETDERIIAGFEITNISEKDLNRLVDFMEKFTHKSEATMSL